MNKYTHIINRLAALSMLTCATVLTAATPLVEIDFNDANGNQSLVSRGSATATGSWVGTTAPTFSTNVAPVNSSGYSGSFNGTDGSYASYGAIGAIDGLTSFTITGWINPVTTQTSGSARLVVYKQALQLTAGIDIFLYGNNKISVGVDGTTIDATLATTTVTVNQWNFFAVTYDGSLTSNNLNIYIGNQTSLQLAYTVTLNQGIVGTATGQVLTVGGAESTANRNYTGLIDDVQIYGSTTNGSGVLSLSELNTIRLSNDVAAIPEPSTYALLVSLLAIVGTALRRKR